MVGTHTWGSSNNNKTINKDDIDYETFCSINKVVDNTENNMIIQQDEDGVLNGYKFDCARLQMMFYDYCRVYLFNKYLKKYDPIRIATDCIFIDCELDDDDYETIGDELGGLKMELYLKNIVYPNANHSFKNKNNYVKGVYLFDSEKDAYVSAI